MERRSTATIIVSASGKHVVARMVGAWRSPTPILSRADDGVLPADVAARSTARGFAGHRGLFSNPLKVALMGGSGAGDSSRHHQGRRAGPYPHEGQLKKGEIREEKRSSISRAAEAEQARREKAKTEANSRRASSRRSKTLHPEAVSQSDIASI